MTKMLIQVWIWTTLRLFIPPEVSCSPSPPTSPSLPVLDVFPDLLPHGTSPPTLLDVSRAQRAEDWHHREQEIHWLQVIHVATPVLSPGPGVQLLSHFNVPGGWHMQDAMDLEENPEEDMQEKQGREVIWWCRQCYRTDSEKKEECHAAMEGERGTKMRNLWISSSDFA